MTLKGNARVKAARVVRSKVWFDANASTWLVEAGWRRRVHRRHRPVLTELRRRAVDPLRETRFGWAQQPVAHDQLLAE